MVRFDTMEQDNATFIGDIFNGPLGLLTRVISGTIREKLTYNAFGVSEDLLRI